MITKEQATGLTYGQVIYHLTAKNSDGSAQRFKVNGKVKTWKRQPLAFQVPLKRGLYEYGYLDQYNASQFSVKEP